MDEYQKKKHSAAVLPAECFFFLVMYDHETAVTPGFAQDAAMREILDCLSIAYSFCFTTSSLISSSRVLCIDPIYTLAEESWTGHWLAHFISKRALLVFLKLSGQKRFKENHGFCFLGIIIEYRSGPGFPWIRIVQLHLTLRILSISMNQRGMFEKCFSMI